MIRYPENFNQGKISFKFIEQRIDFIKYFVLVCINRKFS